jgi:type III secretion protein D
MKQLRILTGRHAGTDVLLEPSTLRIGADAEADLQITDWTTEPLTLNITRDEDDMYTAAFTVDDHQAAQTLEDFVPRRFAEVVLCIGSALREAWPSDLALMQALLQPAAAARPQPLRAPETAKPAWRGWLIAGSAMAAATIGGAFYMVVSAAAQNAELRAQPSLLARAQQAIDRSRVSGVVASSSPDGVVIQGLLPSASDVSRLRAELVDLPPGAVQHRYAAAADIAQGISEALAAPGLNVRHLSGGDFIVEGEAVHAAALQPAADRLINDLAPWVHSIRVSVKDLPPPPRMPTAAMLQVSGMEYVQTRDGTKHVSLLPIPVPLFQEREPGLTQITAFVANKE